LSQVSHEASEPQGPSCRNASVNGELFISSSRCSKTEVQRLGCMQSRKRMSYGLSRCWRCWENESV